MIAVGYVRRSKESGQRTVSLEDQAERIAGYCAEQAWTLAEVLVDDGVSGGRRERLSRIEAAVRRHRAGALVVYHLDRLARDAAALLDWLERGAGRRIELHVVGRGRIEAQSATGYLMVGVEGLVAAHYRKVISEKTRDALARLRLKGRRVSRWAPYGFRFGQDGRLEADPKEQATLGRIVDLRAAGLSLRAISLVLAREGLVARSGRPFAPKVLLTITRSAVGDRATATG